MNRVPVMKGKKVALVVPEKVDAEVWYQGINNIEIQKYLTISAQILHKETEEEYYEYIRKHKAGRHFSIYLIDDKKVIGNIGFHDISDLERKSDIGIMICDINEQNKGYGTEALELLIKYGFTILGLNKIKISYISFNKRAEKIYQKLGFTTIGVQKQEYFIHGKYYDAILMEMMRSEYES